LKKSSRGIYWVLTLIFLGLAVPSCSKHADDLAPSFIPKSNRLVATTGTESGLWVQNHRIGNFEQIDLNIDCYIMNVASSTLENHVIVGATRSRNNINSPSGIYLVDLETGLCTLLTDDSRLVAGRRQVVAVSPNLIIVVTATDIYEVALADPKKVSKIYRVADSNGLWWSITTPAIADRAEELLDRLDRIDHDQLAFVAHPEIIVSSSPNMLVFHAAGDSRKRMTVIHNEDEQHFNSPWPQSTSTISAVSVPNLGPVLYYTYEFPDYATVWSVQGKTSFETYGMNAYDVITIK